MNEFTIGGAWSQGFQFVSRGTLVHFLILTLIGIVAPLAVQYGLLGRTFETSPMAGQQVMMVGFSSLLAIALSHVLQAGSYFAALRFGFTDASEPVGAIAYGLAAGFVATLVVAIAYAIAIFGAPAVMSSGSIFVVFMVLMLPLVFVFSLFFISQAIMTGAIIIITLVYALIVAGAPVGGAGELILILLVMSGLLFWLAARFSCVTAVMAQRASPNVFEAIAESWRMTADEQFAIMRYLVLVGSGVGLIVFFIGLALGSGAGGFGQGAGLGTGGVGDVVLRLVLGIPMAFLSVILPAGIYQQLNGEETSVEVFE